MVTEQTEDFFFMPSGQATNDSLALPCLDPWPQLCMLVVDQSSNSNFNSQHKHRTQESQGTLENPKAGTGERLKLLA